MQTPIPPALDPADDERAAKIGKAIVATLVFIGILVVCVVAIVLIRNLSTQPAQIENPPTATPYQSPRSTLQPSPPTASPTPQWHSVTQGLSQVDFREHRIVQCGDELYLAGYGGTADRIYVLRDFCWVPVASYEAHVGGNFAELSNLYVYDGQLFVEDAEQTHVKRADDTWFSVPRLDWLDSTRYSLCQVSEQGIADGLYAIAQYEGKIFRFQDEEWQSLPDLTPFDPLLGRFPLEWNTPRIFAAGNDMFISYGKLGGNFLLAQQTADGWELVTGPAGIETVICFEDKLHILTTDNQLYRKDPEGWTDITAGISDRLDGEGYCDYLIHEETLYLDMNRDIYRWDSTLWTPLNEGLSLSEKDVWSFLYPTEMGLLLDVGTQGIYRLGESGWTRLTGTPWDSATIYGALNTNGMSFVYTSDGMYRLYRDGTTERTTTSGVGNIIAYQGGYIEENWCLDFHRDGKAVRLEAGLPLVMAEDVTYHHAADEIYAFGKIKGSEYVFYWNGTSWDRVRFITNAYPDNNNAVIYQGDLFVCDREAIYRVSAGQAVQIPGARIDANSRLEIVGDDLLLHNDNKTYRLMEYNYWYEITTPSETPSA